MKKRAALRKAAGHRLTAHITAEDLPLVNGDYSTLQRLLWILIDNAVKYTAQPGQIAIELCERGETLVLSVRDTGIGIASSDLPYVFDRFYRADRSRSQVEGSGLGLAIAKWIAEVHRAEISVRSREGEGADFSVAFRTLRQASAAVPQEAREVPVS